MAAATGSLALDALPRADFVVAVAPLFEGAPRFLDRLAGARPFGSPAAMFDRALDIALAMPEDEQVELVDAHPRLGAAPVSVSALSFREQGYAAGDGAIEAGGAAAGIAAELDRLNDAYEARFGFRYCVFVAGRSRAELIPHMAAALSANRAAELQRAIRAVIDIARDRFERFGIAADEAGA
jgi:2-oxo-4-hydroxy-4-carboxy--5-ureidoimidazoline (OHCU) decarboxylase